MRKKIIKWLLLLGIITSTSICTYIMINYSIVQKQRQKYLVKITGAVYYPGEYLVLEETSLLEVLQNARIKEYADLSKLDLNRKISKNEIFNIEITKGNAIITKIIFDEIKDIKDLFKLKISKSIINKIWDYKKTHTNYSWSDIEKIKGIGDKILIYLKNHIIL